MKNRPKIYFLAVVLLLPFFSVIAQTNTWDGSTDGDWHKDCNWSLNLVPTCAHSVVIPTVGTTYPTITGTAHSLSVAITTTASDALTINSSGGAVLYVASSGGSCSGTATNNTGGGTPTATAASGVGNTSFTANWNSVAGATTYYLDVSTNSSFTTFLSGFNANNTGLVTSKSVTGLDCSKSYYYRVRAGNACGIGSYSNTITATTTGTPPAVPVATAATGVFQGNFTANWNSVAGATSYILTVTTLGTFDVGNVTSYSACVNCGSGTQSYSVQSSNGCVSASSNVINFTPGACNTCNFPNITCESDPCQGVTICVCSSCECP